MSKIDKSTRHTKIVGDFCEQLILYWLNRSGFEAVRVDHTGIDVVAYNRKTKERIGIAVTSRTFDPGREGQSVYLFGARTAEKLSEKRKLVTDACKAFACVPWIGVYVETEKYGDLYLTSLKNYDKKYRSNERRTTNDWKMGRTWKEIYKNDTGVKHIHFDFNLNRWKWSRSRGNRK